MTDTAPPELIFVHCDDCGCRISRPRLGGTYRCEDCKRRRKQAQGVACEGRHLDCTRRWKILRDVLPYEDGGFSPGALFSDADLANMLRLKVIGAGTTLMYVPTRKHFKVMSNGSLKNGTLRGVVDRTGKDRIKFVEAK
jgi:hypothetical protein